MHKNLKWKFGLILGIVFLSLYFILTKSINPGIDIAGGTHFVIEVSVNDLPKERQKAVLDQTVALYKKRLDTLGLSGTTVQPSGTNRVIVQVPGVDTDEANRIKAVLRRQGHLEFKLVDDGPFDRT
jgi:preprotein translocase subunit SecD